ncbi:MAG: hypothetical protein ChlgKO_01210 [Chlamydiales bacterium]
MAGHAKFCEKGRGSLEITASDKTILHFEKFDVGRDEKVAFVQPSKKATVLSRVDGADASEILGRLESNGRLFLVNPNGVVFGKQAVVNTGAFIASSLDIADEDFLADRFAFVLGKKGGSIINQGKITGESFVALMAPVVRNFGSVFAKAGKVALASAEKVVLDFNGDGLMQFVVEGELEEALIENSGKIAAANGSVELSMATVRDAVRMVVNSEGAVAATSIQEVNGVFRLCAGNVKAEGCKVEGDHVEIAAEKRVQFHKSEISVSSNFGGGSVSIFGDEVIFDRGSFIYADSRMNGDGGVVRLIGESALYFDGRIFACGGEDGGNGGFVETSGFGGGSCNFGFVDTSAPKGKLGDWLTDPSRININASGKAALSQVSPPNCSKSGNFTIAASTITSARSNVTLCAGRNANSRININTDLVMENSGVALTLSAGSTGVGRIRLRGTVATKGGDLTFNGQVQVNRDSILNTAGGDVTFSDIVYNNRHLTIDAGSGVVTFNKAVGSPSQLRSLTVTAGTIAQNSTVLARDAISYTADQINLFGNQTTLGGTISWKGAALLGNDIMVDATNAGSNTVGADITIGLVDGAKKLTINAGTQGDLLLQGVIGNSTPPSSLEFTAKAISQQAEITSDKQILFRGDTTISSNITTNGGYINFYNPLTLGADVVLDTTNGGTFVNGANIYAYSTINGTHDLSFSAGNFGDVDWIGTAGGLAPLKTITVNSCNNFIARAVHAESFLQHSGRGYTHFMGALALSGSSGLNATCNLLTFADEVTTANGGALTANTTQLNILQTAVLNIDGPIVQTGTNSFVRTWGKMYTDGDPITLAGTVLLQGNSVMGTGSGAGDISFANPIYGAFDLSLTAGTGDISFGGQVGLPTRMGALTVNSCNDLTSLGITASSIVLDVTNALQVTGDLNTIGSSGILITGNEITHSGTIITTNMGPCTINNSGLYTEVFSVTASVDGDFTQNGAGPVNFEGNLSSVSGDIAMSSPVTLTAITAFSTALGGGDVSLADEINGNVVFTVGSGTGDITFSGDVAVEHLIIDSGNTVSLQGVAAGRISQLDGVGTTTFNGDLTTTDAAGIVLTGSGFTFFGDVTTDLLSINNSGLFTQGIASSISVVNAFTQSGAGGSSLANTINAGGTIAFSGPVSCAADSALTAGGNITFANTLGGAATLTLSAGSNDIAMNGTVSLDDLLITSCRDWEMGIAVTNSITLSSGSGTSTFKGAITSGATSLTGGAFVVESSISGASFSVNNSATFTAITGSAITLTGGFSQTGAGAFQFNGAMNAGDISIASPITLFGNSSFVGGDVSLGAIDGAFDLTLGGHDLVFGPVGNSVPLTSLVVSSANDVTAQAMTLGSFSQSAGTGTTTLNGVVNSSNAAGIAITATNISVLASLNTAASGPMTLSASGALVIQDDLSASGVFSAPVSGTIFLGADITTVSQDLTLSGPVILTADAQVNSSNGAGNVTFSGSCDGGFALTAIAGEGDLTFGGAIGSTTALSSLMGSGTNIMLSNVGGGSEGITGATNLTATTALSLSGVSYRLNPFTITAPTLNINSGALTNIITSSDAVAFSSNLVQFAANSDLSIATAGGAITLPSLCGSTNSSHDVTLNSGSGTIDLLTIGSPANGEFGTLSITGGDLQFRGNVEAENITLASSGTIFLGSNITTTGGSIVFPAPLIRDTSINAIIKSAADITFQNTIDAETAGLRNLTLYAPSGDILVTGAIGATTPLLTFLIPAVQDFTALSNIDVVNIAQISGAGTSLFQGTLQSSGVVGIDLGGTNFTFQDAITTTNGGNFILKNTGVCTFESGATVTSSGKFTQTLSGTLSLSNSITVGNTVAIAGATTLAGASSIDSGNHAITFSGTLDGGNDLALSAGTNSITFDGVVGGTARLGALTISSSSNILFNQAVYVASLDANWTGGAFTTMTWLDSNAPAGISAIGTDFVAYGGMRVLGGGSLLLNTTGQTTGLLTQGVIVSGDVTQLATGTGLIGGYFALGGNFNSNHGMLLAADLTIDSSGGNGNIHLENSVDGDYALTLIAGSGDITFSGSVGSSIPIKTMQVVSCGDFTAESTLYAKTLTQVSGSGLTHFQDDVTVSALCSLTGTNVMFDKSLTTIDGASTSITNSGLLTIQDDFSLDGSFTQSGTGTVSMKGSLVTTGDAIAFASPITMMDNLTLSSGTGVGDIMIGSTVQGAHNLLLDAKGGDLVIGGDVGLTATPIGSFTISSANDVSIESVFATNITLTNSTGSATFGKLQSDAVGGIKLTGNEFSFTDTITTTGLGSFHLVNSGAAVFQSLATTTVDGAFSIAGSGALTLSSNISSVGVVSISPIVVCSGSASINSNNQNITFNNAIDGGGDLTLTAGMGNILFLRDIGATTRFGHLTISSATNVSTESISASRITQSAGSGLTLFQGDLDTDGVGGIQLTGTNFTCQGAHVTANGGIFSVNNSGTFTMTAGFTAGIDGAFAQTGSGPVEAVGSFLSTNGSLHFSSAITLVGDLTLGGDGITLQNSVDGFFDLTLSAGTGDITLGGAVGTTTRLEDLTITSAHNVDTNDLIAATITIDSSTGTVSILGDLNTLSPGGISFTGTNFVRNGNVTTTGGGTVTINNSGTVTGTLGNTTSIDGGYFLNGPGSVNFVGGITTSNGPIVFAGDVTLIGDATFTTGNGDVTFANIDGAHNLTIDCGEGDCTFQNAVGSVTPLSALTITSAGNITAEDSFAASSISAPTVSLHGDFQGPVTVTGNTNLSGTRFTFGDDFTGDALTVSLTGASPFTSGNIALDGALSISGGGSYLFGGAITTTADPVTIAIPVELTADSSITTAGGDITCTELINGAFDLTLSAESGDLQLGVNVASLTVSSGNDLTLAATTASGAISTTVSGLTTISGTLLADSIALTTATMMANSAITSSGGAISITNSGAALINEAISSATTFTQSGVGGFSLGGDLTAGGAVTIAAATTLLSPVTITSGDLRFASTIGGTEDLTISAAGSDVTFSGALTVEDLLIQSARDVNCGAITCETFTQLASSGTTTLSGSVASSGAGGINLRGSQFVIEQSITTTNGGPFLLVHVGVVTLADSASFHLDGNFVEQGFGTVTTGANVTTTGDRIHFKNAVVLSEDVTLDSGTGPGNIEFVGALSGARDLTLLADLGNVTFSGATSLNSLASTANSTIINTSLTTTAATDITGQLRLGGDLTTTNSDLSITGDLLRIATNDATIATGSGNLLITGDLHSDVVGRNLTCTSTGNVTMSGAIGSGVPLANLTCSGAAIFFDDVLSVTGTLSLNALGAINFAGTTYNAKSHLYTAGTFFDYTGGSLTTVSANAQAVTYTTGTIQLGTATNLSVLGNGGDVTFGDLLGDGHDLIVDAGVGAVVVNDLGTPANQLNNVLLAGATVSHGTIEASGLITITTTNPVIISSNITTGGADLVYNAPVIFAADNLSIITDGGSIIFHQSVDSDNSANARNILFDTDFSPVTFNSPIGGSESITSLTFHQISDLHFAGMVTVGNLVQTAGSGTTTFLAGLASNGLNLQTDTVDVVGALTTANGGAMNFDVATLLQLNDTNISSDGSITQTGAGAISIGGSVTTTGDAVTFAGTTTLTSDLEVSTAGGDFTHTGLVDGNFNMTFDVGDLTFSQNIGATTAVKVVTITNVVDSLFADLSAAALTQVAGSGTTTFNGALSTDTVSGIVLEGTNFSFQDGVTTTNNGPIVVTNSGTLTVNGAINSSKAFVQMGAGTNLLAGSITAGSPIQFASDISLQGNLLLDTSANGTNITLSGDVSGAHNLDLIAGTGSIVLQEGNISDFTVESAKNVTAQNITATALVQIAGSGLSTFANIDAGSVSLVGTNFTFAGDLISSGSVAIAPSGLATLQLTSGTAITGAFTQTGAGSVALSGTFVAGATSFASPIALNGDTTMTTGNLTFNAPLSGAYDLTITANDLLFNTISEVKALSIVNANDVTYAVTTLESLNQQASTGATTIGGVITTTGIGGIAISGTTISQNANLSTFAKGPITITHSGLYTCNATNISDGAFLETGGGAVAFNGTVSAFNDPIQFDGAITLTGAMLLTTQGDITLNGTLDGAFGATFEAGTGDIALNGVTTGITAFTVNSAHDVTLNDITVTSLTQNHGTGITTFEGDVTATTIGLVGTDFSVQQNVVGGTLSVTQAGDLTFAVGSDVSTTGDITTMGQGAIVISGDLSSGGAISLHTEVSILGTATLDTSANNTNITLLGTLEGSGDVTLTLGSGDLNVHGDVGGVTPLGSITIVSCGDTELHNITAESIVQSSGTGETHIHGDIHATGAGGISFTTPTLTLYKSLTSAGATVLTNSAALSLPIAETINCSGAFTQGGGGRVTLGSNISASDISFADPFTLSGNIVLDTSGGEITLSGAVNGTQNLTLTAGSGNISMSTANLKTLTFTSAHDIRTGALSCGAIQQVAGSGTTTITGNMSTNTPAGMQFVGTNFDHTGALMTTNAGSFVGTFTGTVASNSANTTTVDNAYILTAPAMDLQGTFTTLQGAIELHGAVTLVEALTLNSSAGAGGILIDGTLAGGFGAAFLAGPGNVTIGDTTGLGSLAILGSEIHLANINGTMGTTAVTATADIIFAGTSYSGNTQTYATPFDFVMSSGALTTIDSNGSDLNFVNGIIRLDSTTDLSLQSNGGNLSTGMIRAASTSSRTLIADSGSGNLQIVGLGSIGGNEYVSATLNGNDVTFTAAIISDQVTISGTGTVFAGGNITTNAAPISISAPVVLTATNTFTSNGGDITFGGTIEDSAVATNSLYLDSGAGNITFDSTIGATARPFLLRVTESNNMTLNDAVTADFIWFSGGAGRTTFDGSMTVMGVNGISLSGNEFIFNNLVDTTSTIAQLRITNSGTLTFAGTATLSGSFSQQGAGSTVLSGSITADQHISFVGPVSLLGTPTLSTAATNQNIDFAAAVDGVGDLILSAGVGNITFATAVGAETRVGNIVVSSANDLKLEAFTATSIHSTTTGTAELNGALNCSGNATFIGVDVKQNSAIAANGLTVTNSGNYVQKPFTTTTLSGPFLQDGTGPFIFSGVLNTSGQDITVTSAIITLYNSSMNSCGGDILFASTVDGNWDFSVAASSGDITFSGPVGLFTPMKALTIVSANDVTTSSIITNTLTQSAGTGTTTLGGAITTTGTGGISLTGTNFVRGASWNASGTGEIRIDNSATFTSNAAGTLFSGGKFAQVGSGIVNLAGAVKTQNSALSFAGPITLTGDTLLSTDLLGGAITLASSVDGNFNLTLNAGTGNITTSEAIGAGERLGTFTVEHGADATFAPIAATTIQQIESVGTATYNGAVDATGNIALTGNAITLNGSVNGTALLIKNRGLLTQNAPVTLSSTFTQAEIGSVALNDSIATNGAVLFVSPITVTNSASINSSSNSITLSKTVDGPGSITLDAGTSTIALQGEIGATTALNNFAIVNASSVDSLGIRADTISQTATTIGVTGNLHGITSALLNGTTITLDGDLLGGSSSFQHTGELTLHLGNATSLSSNFTESGGGSSSISGTLLSTGGAIDFAGPITLVANTNMQSKGALTTQSTIDGAFSLTLDSEAGNIDLQGNCTVGTFLINTANNVTTEALSATTITQTAGSGRTTFNGAISSTSPAGINLTGEDFAFNSFITTTNNGPLNITNRGELTLTSAANITLSGSFSQLGTGTTLLDGQLATNGANITFTGPITLTGNATLQSGIGPGDIKINGAINGAQNVLLQAGNGSVTIVETVGGIVPIGLLSVTDAQNFTSGAIFADSITLANVAETTTLSMLTTTNSIKLGGNVFVLNGDIETTSGDFAIDNFGACSTADIVFDLGGKFTATNSGTLHICGRVETNGNNITIDNPILLPADLYLNSSGGDILLQGGMEGNSSVAFDAGSGNITLTKNISTSSRLKNFTIANANGVTLTGIGKAESFLSGAITINAAGTVYLNNDFYGAKSQKYTSSQVDISSGTETTICSDGEAIIFGAPQTKQKARLAPPDSPVYLTSGSNLTILTNNGAFIFNAIDAAGFENVTIDTGTNMTTLRKIGTGANINSLTVTAGEIVIEDEINVANLSFTAAGLIHNATTQKAITTEADAFFNSQTSDIGSKENPLLVHSSQKIIAGGVDLAAFDGSSQDKTVHAYVENPPCVIYFNGVMIKDCNATSDSNTVSQWNLGPIRGFIMPGSDSSQFNLSSDYYFKFYFLNTAYTNRGLYLYKRQ